jgi:hypothetical protein
MLILAALALPMLLTAVIVMITGQIAAVPATAATGSPRTGAAVGFWLACSAPNSAPGRRGAYGWPESIKTDLTPSNSPEITGTHFTGVPHLDGSGPMAPFLGTSETASATG